MPVGVSTRHISELHLYYLLVLPTFLNYSKHPGNSGGLCDTPSGAWLGMREQPGKSSRGRQIVIQDENRDFDMSWSNFLFGGRVARADGGAWTGGNDERDRRGSERCKRGGGAWGGRDSCQHGDRIAAERDDR